MAGDPMPAVLLVGMGFDELSMSSSGLAKLKRVMALFSRAECHQLARRATEEMASGHEVMAMMANALLDKGQPLLVPPRWRHDGSVTT
jgi:Phosphoenolpyruvate-protein kinase (PTS system EI component in bacteria)